MRHGRRVTLALPLCFFQISLSRSTRAIVFFGVGRGVRPSLVGADHVSISGRAAIKSIDWASGALELGRHDSVGRRLLVGTTRLSGLLYELRSGKGFFVVVTLSTPGWFTWSSESQRCGSSIWATEIGRYR